MKKNLNWLVDRINGVGAPLIIDGGMGTELQKSGVPMDNKVWSGRAVLSHPEAIVHIHEAFIRAGAEVIITNTFATARQVLEPGGLGEQVRKINLNAVKLAREARNNVAVQPVAVVGSICEWAPNDDPNWRSAKAVHASALEQAEILAEGGVDLIALEMCEKVELSIAVIEAALQTGLPIWIGMSAQAHKGHDSLSAFDFPERNFEDLVEALAGYPAMMMNIMHTPISDIDESMAIVKRYWKGPVGIYPESGYFTLPDWHFVDIVEPKVLADLARVWVEHGVRMVGGCCGLGPQHIAALRQVFKTGN